MTDENWDIWGDVYEVIDERDAKHKFDPIGFIIPLRGGGVIVSGATHGEQLPFDDDEDPEVFVVDKEKKTLTVTVPAGRVTFVKLTKANLDNVLLGISPYIPPSALATDESIQQYFWKWLHSHMGMGD